MSIDSEIQGLCRNSQKFLQIAVKCDYSGGEENGHVSWESGGCGWRIRLARCRCAVRPRKSSSTATSARSSPISALPATVRMPPSGRPNCGFDTEAGARIELAKGRFAIVPGDPERANCVRRVTSAGHRRPHAAGLCRTRPAEARRNRTDPPLDRAGRALAAVLVVHPAAAARAARRFATRTGCAIRSTASFWPAWNAKDCIPPPEADRRTLAPPRDVST